MRLYVVAYPELDAADYQLIDDSRRQYDRLYGMIDAHITLVFLVDDMTPEDFIAEVKQQTAGAKAFDITLRACTINKDTFSEHYFAFVVPDEGNSDIIKLHDKLYSGKLTHHHRMDIDYIPHILIATSLDKSVIKNIVDEWNTKNFEFIGKVKALDIISFENGITTVLDRVVLQ
jgi:2'-5' RNA ligase